MFLTIFTKARLFYLKFPRLEINRSIAERTLVEITIGRLVPFQFHRGTSIDRSIRRLHQHLRSIRIGEGLQTTRIRRAWWLGRRGKPALDPAFFDEENVRHEFLFHSTHASPLPLPPFIRPFFLRVPRRDVHVPSYPSSSRSPPFLLEWRVRSFLRSFVLGRKKRRVLLLLRGSLRASFVSCFVHPRTRMITIRFLFFPFFETRDSFSFSSRCKINGEGRIN